jgi:hypothetical protein
MHLMSNPGYQMTLLENPLQRGAMKNHGRNPLVGSKSYSNINQTTAPRNAEAASSSSDAFAKPLCHNHGFETLQIKAPFGAMNLETAVSVPDFCSVAFFNLFLGERAIFVWTGDLHGTLLHAFFQTLNGQPDVNAHQLILLINVTGRTFMVITEIGRFSRMIPQSCFSSNALSVKVRTLPPLPDDSAIWCCR